MSRWLLDTNVVSELRKKRPDAKVVQWMRAAGSENIFLSTIAFAEIRYGIALQTDPDARSQLETWLETSVRSVFSGRILGVDEGVLFEWRLLGGALARQKRTVPEPDLLLAALARHNRMQIASRDIKHLEVTGVPVLNPWTGECHNGA
ncbi:MAG: type II toxin-antitoxin system VapC family toxin [Rhizobiales bacterium]|nr:type II toxin-antitoxin system VapC family toxin [Hyphomicrobiales bacterium]MBI3673617.1 type II toxin-antitoxin system VapC family toxin [Hyphomicrobiales bacterium]